MKPERNVWVQVGRYLTLGMLMPACVLVGYILGYLLDRYFGTTYLYLVGLLLGIAAGFIELLREVQKDAGD